MVFYELTQNDDYSKSILNTWNLITISQVDASTKTYTNCEKYKEHVGL